MTGEYFYKKTFVSGIFWKNPEHSMMKKRKWKTSKGSKLENDEMMA